MQSVILWAVLALIQLAGLLIHDNYRQKVKSLDPRSWGDFLVFLGASIVLGGLAARLVYAFI